MRVQVAVGRRLEEPRRHELTDSVRRMVGGKPVLETEVWPELIGGMVLRVGDTVYDGSVATRLEQIRQQMIDRSVHEIQSRRDRFRHPGRKLNTTSPRSTSAKSVACSEVGDGIARVYGLSGVMAGEMVEFPNGTIGLAFNLEENSVGVIILGDYLQINEGDEVKSTGQLLSVPVGDAVIGRVVDPLGNPLDGKGPIVTSERRDVETMAPGVAQRQAGHASRCKPASRPSTP